MNFHPDEIVQTPAVASGLRQPAAEGSEKRLLLVKFGAIGDVIMAIPAAAMMHAAGFAIDWVAGDTVASVLALYPWIRVFPVQEAKLLRGTAGDRLRALTSLWRQLRAARGGAGEYALCATLYYDRRYRLLTLPIPARRRLQLSTVDRSRRLLPGRHHSDEYARILTGRTDGEVPTQIAPIPIPALPPCAIPKPGGQARVVLVPAAARNALRDDALRRWPVEHYVETARRLLAAGHQVILSGGPEDRWASPFFSDLVSAAREGAFYDRIGTETLLETLALLDSAEVTVTHDTGPLHMAGITSTGIVAIFGPTDPRGRLPRRANCVALWGGEGFACRPCYDGRDYAPCQHNGCVRQVTPELVEAEVEELLRVRRQGGAVPPRVAVPEASAVVQIGHPAGRSGTDVKERR